MGIGIVYRRLTFGKEIGIIFLAILLQARGAGAATLTVDDSGGADYTRIQDAINNANTGDTILVYSGTYYENVDVNKELILRGLDNGGGKPLVDGYNTGRNWFAITLTAGRSTLEGFATTNTTGQSWPNAGIILNSNDNIIKNSTSYNNVIGIFSHAFGNNTLNNNNVRDNNYGIYVDSSSNTLIGNNISDNAMSGIYVSYSSSNLLSGNNISNNAEAGIYFYSSSNNILKNNNASNNNYGIYLGGSSNNILSSNNASKNNYGIYLRVPNSNNTLSDNIALNNNYYGISLLDSSYNLLSNNIASNNSIGINLDSSLSPSYSNLINGNKVSNNSVGIRLVNSANNNTLKSNTVSNNNESGISIFSSSNCIIYDNFFNNINNFQIFFSANNWNITKTLGNNIVVGPYLGGNVWAYPNGTGFSQTCTDSDSDGLCDSPYVLDSNNIDYLPLSINFTIPIAGLRGDINRNDRLDTGDATLILRYIVHLPIPSQYMPLIPTGDMNCNGKIDTGDATIILRMIVGLPVPKCWE
jgi:nitrous oxidase accessory protein